MDKTDVLEETTSALRQINRKINFIRQNIEGLDATSMFYKLHCHQIGKLQRQSSVLKQYIDNMRMVDIQSTSTWTPEQKLRTLEGLRAQSFMRPAMVEIVDKHMDRLSDAR